MTQALLSALCVHPVQLSPGGRHRCGPPQPQGCGHGAAPIRFFVLLMSFI